MMHRKLLRGTASAFAIAMATMGMAHAQAQEATEVVTVTGVRASLNNALEAKQNAGQIIDSIVAEDIGKLPDSTLVESLQHVTGVAILRNNVEPNTVLIRGLPDIQTLLNGREIFSSTGRAITLSDFPSELLQRVDVHKASSATDIQGGSIKRAKAGIAPIGQRLWQKTVLNLGRDLQFLLKTCTLFLLLNHVHLFDGGGSKVGVGLKGSQIRFIEARFPDRIKHL